MEEKILCGSGGKSEMKSLKSEQKSCNALEKVTLIAHFQMCYVDSGVRTKLCKLHEE